jgi:methionyl-tRNA formyltransferase
MGKRRIIFLGQGIKASKTLERLNKNKSIDVIFCSPRISDHENLKWFDDGILSDKVNELGIELLIHSNLNSEKFVDIVEKSKIDLIVNVGHGQLFKANLINSAKMGILNYHPGLLPFGRGSGAVVGEIINNVFSIGRTCHLVDEHFDRGIIISQQEFDISDTTTLNDASELLDKDIDLFVNNAVEKVFTDFNNTDKIHKLGFGRYYPKFVEGDDFINWNDTSLNIYNKVRSRLFERLSVIYTKNDLKKFLVAGVKIANHVEDYISVNGQVIDKSSIGVLVKTNDSAIWITQIIDPKTGAKYVPKFNIGKCFQTLNISDFINLMLNSKNINEK